MPYADKTNNRNNSDDSDDEPVAKKSRLEGSP